MPKSESSKTKLSADGAVNLRGHQLLCVLGFRGYGYSPAFVANMTAIVERMRADDHTPVHITSIPADLCSACPNLGPKGCASRPGSEKSVHSHDLAVMERLGISEGETISWGTIQQRIVATMQPDSLQALCHNCRWLPYGYCAEGLSQLLASYTERR